MKRGRKTAAREKVSGPHSRGALVGGKNPHALHFAKWLMRAATENKPPGAVPPVDDLPLGFWYREELASVAPTLSQYPELVPTLPPIEYALAAAREGDDSFANFLESAARQVRAGLHREMFVDAPRLALRYMIEAKIIAAPVNVTDAVALLGKEGITVSERFIADECKALKVEVRRRGRP